MTPPLEVKMIDGRLWYVDVTPGKPDRKIAPYPAIMGTNQLGGVAPGGIQGNPGLSAYQLAVQGGFTGSVLQWLDSLKGQPGTSSNGRSAYELAVTAGFVGTLQQWLDSLKGVVTGGNDGKSAFQVAQSNGYLGTQLEWLASLKSTAPGKSAYEVAVDGGFLGTRAQWLASLKSTEAGPVGADAYAVAVLAGFTGTRAQWLASLKSTEPGSAGPDAYQVAVSAGFVGTRAQWLATLKGEASTVPGPAAVAGRLEANTTNTPGNIYMRTLNTWKLLRPSSHEKAQGVIAICDKNRDMIGNGSPVDLTGLGFQEGVYYVEDTDAAGRNLALTPRPLTSAQTPTLARSFLSVGTLGPFNAQTLLDFFMQANIVEGAAYAQLSRTVFADLLYNVTPSQAQIGRLIDTQAPELALSRLLADGDADAQGAFLETSPVTRSIGGVNKGVFLQDVGYGGLHVRIPAGWENLGAGDYLLTYAQADNDNIAGGPCWGASATALHRAMFFGGSGLIDYVIVQKATISGAVVTGTTLNERGISTGVNKLKYFHVRFNISSDRLTLKIKVWPRNVAKSLERQEEDEPALPQLTYTSPTPFPIGSIGWTFSNGSVRRVMASRSPDPLIKALFLDQL